MGAADHITRAETDKNWVLKEHEAQIRNFKVWHSGQKFIEVRIRNIYVNFMRQQNDRFIWSSISSLEAHTFTFKFLAIKIIDNFVMAKTMI